MPPNTYPIFALTPFSDFTTLRNTTQNNTSTGAGTIGTDIFKIFSAGANGSFVEKILMVPVGNEGLEATSASVYRFYFSTQSSGSTTASNT
jgi:hypothetical protein